MIRIVEQKVSAGNRGIFDLDEFLSRPLYAHLAHQAEQGPRESPVWFHWDGGLIWIIGGTSFPKNLKREPVCAIGIVDWDVATGLNQHVGLRGRAEVVPFDAERQRQFSGGISVPTSRNGTDVSPTCSLESWDWSLFASFQRLSSCAISRTLLPNGLGSAPGTGGVRLPPLNLSQGLHPSESPLNTRETVESVYRFVRTT